MEDATLAWELRDGLLQDLVAVGLLIEGARRSLRDGGSFGDAEALLCQAAGRLHVDADEVRTAIARLRADAA